MSKKDIEYKCDLCGAHPSENVQIFSFNGDGIKEKLELILNELVESETITKEVMKKILDREELERTLICSDCFLSGKNAAENLNESSSKKEISGKSPMDIFNELNEYIIGQDDAKKAFSIAVYNHHKICNMDQNLPDIPEKSNLLLIGPTGSGKTRMVTAFSKENNIPISIEDASSFTANGFVGRSVVDSLKSLLDKADNDIERAEHGIIIFDEIDKLARKVPQNSSSRDIGGLDVQKQLLKIIEGGDIKIPSNDGSPEITFNTRNVQFILAGAFEGLIDIVAKDVDKKEHKGSMGFCSVPKKEGKVSKEDYHKYMSNLKIEHLKEYGLCWEFLGRIPRVAVFNELDLDSLVDILTKPKNSVIKQYKTLFKEDGILLTFDEDALLEIAKRAKKEETGARALKMIIEDILTEAMFSAPDMKNLVSININKDLKAEYVMNNKEVSKNKIMEG